MLGYNEKNKERRKKGEKEIGRGGRKEDVWKASKKLKIFNSLTYLNSRKKKKSFRLI